MDETERREEEWWKQEQNIVGTCEAGEIPTSQVKITLSHNISG